MKHWYSRRALLVVFHVKHPSIVAQNRNARYKTCTMNKTPTTSKMRNKHNITRTKHITCMKHITRRKHISSRLVRHISITTAAPLSSTKTSASILILLAQQALPSSTIIMQLLSNKQALTPSPIPAKKRFTILGAIITKSSTKTVCCYKRRSIW